jgi:hypothetical protein
MGGTRSKKPSMQEIEDDADWARVSEEYAFNLAVSLGNYLAESDCPAPLVRWYCGAIDRALGRKLDRPSVFLEELGFSAGKRRPRLGPEWTARVIEQLMTERRLTWREAIELLQETARDHAGHVVGHRSIEKYIAEGRKIRARRAKVDAQITALRRGSSKKKGAGRGQ